MSEFEIRQAEARDQASLCRLMSVKFAERMRGRYEWMYEGNPHGRALSWLAIDRASGEVAGCTSVFPRRVLVDGRERIGSIGGDCFVDPRFRRRGLATALHRASFATMRQQGVDFMYGPPNPHNLTALLNAGSQVVTEFRRWVRPLRGCAVYRAVFGRAPSRPAARLTDLSVSLFDRIVTAEAAGFTLEPVGRFGDEFDRLFDRAAAVGPRVVCVRDRAYLGWRYLAAPARRQRPLAVRRSGELVGFAAVEISGARAILTDLFTPSDPALVDVTLQLVVDFSRTAGCSTLETGVTRDCLAARRLARLGFIGRDGRQFQVAAAPDDPQIETLWSGASWHLTTADEDRDTEAPDPRPARVHAE